jgi:hypothetical protein
MKKLFLYFLCNTSLFAQTKESVKSLFEKMDHYYSNNKNYSYTSEYFVYENETSNNVADHYEGVLIKKGTVNYQKVNNTEFVNFSDYRVSIDNKEKKIFITKSPKENIQSLSGLLKIYNKSKLEQDKEYWICELSTDKAGNNKQFEKIIVYINKDDYSLHKQLFYTIGSKEVIKNKKTTLLKNPRMEILFKKKKEIESNQATMLSKDYYFSLNKKKFTLSKRFKEYKLITL